MTLKLDRTQRRRCLEEVPQQILVEVDREIGWLMVLIEYCTTIVVRGCHHHKAIAPIPFSWNSASLILNVLEMTHRWRSLFRQDSRVQLGDWVFQTLKYSI